MQTWEETKTILSDLEAFCDQDDDLKRIKNIKRLKSQALTIMNEGELNAKELIVRMTEEVDTVKANADKLASQTPSNPEIEALQNKINMMIKQIKISKEEKQKTEQNLQDLEEQIAKLELSIGGYSKESSYEIPTMRYILSLYANISNIKWDFDGSKNNFICGTVVDSKNGQVKNISIDESHISQFDVANKLWEFIY